MSLASAFTPDRPLVLIGAGKMGGALLAGWLKQGLAPRAAVIVDPAPGHLPPVGVAVSPHVPDGVIARVIVIAIKPQIIADVLPTLRPLIDRDTVVVSIAAGTSLKGLAAGLGNAAIVRAMPNTPAQVGKGVTAAFGNPRVSRSAQTLVDALLAAVGDVIWVEKESLIDSATAVSGSGPAYVFHMVEALAAAGVAVGLDEQEAMRLARGTVVGAGELLAQSDLPAATLRENVTSPNGTTAEALKVLMGRSGLTALMKKAVAAARKRARELAG